MEARQVLEIAISAGKILISNGAETYRVEETIERICNAYDFECECMATAKGVFVSIIGHNEEKTTSLKRIRTMRNDLYRIELVNSFSREIEVNHITYEEAKKRITEIEEAPYFSFPVRLFAASMTSFVYTLFFNGTIYDSLISAIISIFVYTLLEKVSNVGFFQFFQFFFSGFIIGITSLTFQKFLPVVNKDNVITGAIMILLPGVALTNGIKDIMYGDFMSGTVRFGESMLIIIAMGAGIGSALSLGMGVGL